MSPVPAVTARMRRVRQKNTAPEISVRKVLHRIGARFRICPKNLLGRPDIVNLSRGWAIFVHGCFWHGHRNCKLFTLPRTNRAFWKAKIEANRARDSKKEAELRARGLRVAVIWQCQLSDEKKLERQIRRFLEVEPLMAQVKTHPAFQKAEKRHVRRLSATEGGLGGGF